MDKKIIQHVEETAQKEKKPLLPDGKPIFEWAHGITIDDEQDNEQYEEENYDNKNDIPAPNKEDDEDNNDDNRINDNEYE